MSGSDIRKNYLRRMGRILDLATIFVRRVRLSGDPERAGGGWRSGVDMSGPGAAAWRSSLFLPAGPPSGLPQADVSDMKDGVSGGVGLQPRRRFSAVFGADEPKTLQTKGLHGVKPSETSLRTSRNGH